MKKLITTLVILISCICFISAQSQENQEYGKFSIGVDFSTWIISSEASLNLEMLLVNVKSDNFRVYASGGLMRGSLFKSVCNAPYLKGYHTGLTFLSGIGNHHFEMNGGAYFITEHKPESSGLFCNEPKIERKKTIPLIKIGYRYQRPGSGLFFSMKAGWLGGGLGFGYAF